ncbi:MAG: hypothetical protein DRG09_05930 [Epsilonproteobacteria bacterium]|nr:MAG: hypothetical protein DRG09_05930 [Campylobacterota bacterium]
MKKKKLLIIGAGLSGLYTAFLLQDRYDVTVLEARERTGGRILNMYGHDMGPSWVWRHQTYILQLIDSLGLEYFEQYIYGDALYDAPEGVQRFSVPPSAPSYRVKGGMTKIINALEEKMHNSVKINEKVISLIEKERSVMVKTEHDTYEVDKVISTLPPRLAVETIKYDPPLEMAVREQLTNIPTWMGYSAKCVIEFEEAFWREEGLSGFGISHVGPLAEIHDASTGERAALFGFLHSNASYESIKENITVQLTRLYGDKASKPLNIYVVDWKKEIYTSTTLDSQPLADHPSYGFDVKHFNGKLIFSGTESAFKEGGYLEGAANATRNVIKHV